MANRFIAIMIMSKKYCLLLKKQNKHFPFPTITAKVPEIKIFNQTIITVTIKIAFKSLTLAITFSRMSYEEEEEVEE